MASGLDFYVARASEARSEADAALLANVRERCLRSAAAWDAMAERARKTERSRLGRETQGLAAD